MCIDPQPKVSFWDRISNPVVVKKRPSPPPTPLTASQSLLAAENRAVVFVVLRQPRYRPYVRALGWDEAVAVGLLELCKRARTYKWELAVSSYTGRPISFFSYAFPAVAQSVVRAAKQAWKHAHIELQDYRDRKVSPISRRAV